MVKKRKRNLSMSDKIILNSGYILLGIFLLAIIIPLAYIVIASFTDPTVLSSEGITFDFSKWSLDGYKRVLQDYIPNKAVLLDPVPLLGYFHIHLHKQPDVL